MWTHFHDMYSGGEKKEQWNHIFIEAPIDEACSIFLNRFGHDPKRITCRCCGADYSITEGESLEQITAYYRGCKWNDKTKKYEERKSQDSFYPYRTIKEYKKLLDVKFIPKKVTRKEE